MPSQSQSVNNSSSQSHPLLRELISQFQADNPITMQMYHQARQVLPGGLTHAARIWDEDAPGIYVERAEGAYKWDVDKHRHIDYWMGHGSLLFGHANPVIAGAVGDQLLRGTHFGASHPLEVSWAELICQLVPSAQKVRFFSSGTEATLMAMRLARAFKSRDKIIKFGGRFHGWHDYTATTDQGTAPVGIPQSVADQMLVLPASLEVVEKTLSQQRDVAAIIVEADGAGWGAVPNPKGFLAGLRELTQAYGVILIFDEIVSGFRYGSGGIQQLEGVTPDLTTLGKIVAGGLPGGAVAGRAELIEMLNPTSGPHFIQHNGTYNANPLSAKAGIAALSMIGASEASEQIYQPVARLGQRLRDGLNMVFENEKMGGKAVAYGRGSVFHLVLGKPYLTEWPADGNLDQEGFENEFSRPEVQARLKLGAPEEVRLAFRLELDRLGVQFMRGLGGFVSTAHSKQEIDQTIRAVAEAIHTLKRGGLLD